MSATTLLYLIAVAVVALGVSAYMYGFKSRLNPKLRWALGLLRFLTLLCLGVLLINPKIEQVSYYTEKPALNVLVDNSSSIRSLSRDSLVKSLLNDIVTDTELERRFKVQAYQFDQSFGPLDSLDFKGAASDIATGLRDLGAIYDKQAATTVLLTDGNQTLGSNYSSLGNRLKNPVFPLVVGDTTQYEDLRITRVNANRYAYQDNEFPLELSLAYTGDRGVNTNLVIRRGSQVVSRQPLTFNSTNNATTLTLHLKAEQVGIQSYTAELTPLTAERNTNNNYQQFAVEVIDQSTKVAIVASVQHPDLGALKKAITQLKLSLIHI